MNFCPLKMEMRLALPAMLNKTFYVIFKHCGSCPWSLYLFYVWSSIFYQIKFAWADLSKATLYSHVVYKVYHQLLSSSHFSWLQRKNILQSNGDCSSNAYVKLICLMYLDLGLCIFLSKVHNTMFESVKKSHFTALRAKRATFTIFVDKTNSKRAKNGYQIGQVLPDRSISIVQKLMENAKKWLIWRGFERVTFSAKQCYHSGQF